MNWLRRVQLIAAEYRAQQEAVLLLLEQNEQLQRERDLNKLEYVRNTRDLIEHFWYAQEQDMDVREPLLNGLRDLNDEVARLEEHTL